MSDRTFLPRGVPGEQAKFVVIDTRTAYAIMHAITAAKAHTTQDEGWKLADWAAADAHFRNAWLDAPHIEVATLKLKD